MSSIARKRGDKRALHIRSPHRTPTLPMYSRSSRSSWQSRLAGARGGKQRGGGEEGEGADLQARPQDTRLSTSGYSFPKAELHPSELDRIKRELTVSPVVPGGPSGGPPPPSFELWMEGPTRLYVPKFYGLSRFGPPARLTIPEGAPIDVSFTGGLRAEQMEPVAAFMRAADDPAAMGGILSLPCGSGKTVIALHILAALGRKTLIVVHKDFLLQQWKERMETFLPTARVGTVKAKTIDVRDKDVVIASLQSLSMKTYAPDLFSDIGLLIIDEVHRTGTEVFSRALGKVNVRRSLGLSATVKRKDGMTKVFEWYIGRVAFAVSKREDSVDVVMQPFYDRAEEYSEEPCGFGGRVNVSRMINNVTAFAPRTALITSFILDLLDEQPGRRVLVLSDRKLHLEDIARGLVEAQGRTSNTPPVTAGMYVGGMKPDALAASQTRRVILATFSFASEGFDVPGLDTLVLASPKSDIEQSVGRILRQKAEDRLHRPLILDVVDDFSVFKGQAKKRRAFYAKHGYSIHPTIASLGTCSSDTNAEDVHPCDHPTSPGPYECLV